jgi:CO/xanthine dehydrogenase Mo-binding subunit
MNETHAVNLAADATRLAEPVIEVERYELFEGPHYSFAPDRREFVKFLSGGILFCLLADESMGQQPKGGNRPQELSAWLQIGADGQITVATGKTEVGQNIRTSLTQVVAEELRTPMSSIRLVMADTDLVPYDGGTAGSRTTPDMSPQLRRVAAAARELLIDLAAEQAQVERNTLDVANGKVLHNPSKRSFSFGELAKGKKLTKTIGATTPTTPAEKWKIAGTSALKVDGRAMVTGKHRFTSDVKLPGMLYGKVLRPEAIGGTLASVDLKAAEKLAGVTAIRDGEFVGVAAPTEFRAEQALAAIKAEWRAAGEASSSKTLFDDLKKNVGKGGGFGKGGGGFGGGKSTVGSIEKGLAAADHKLQATYTIAYIAHVPLEPRAAVAEWKDGKLTVWAGTQRPFGVKSDLARAFGLAQEKVRVITPDTGSGYGGKHTTEAATEAARLAKAAGKPVKVVWTREEEFTWAYFRPAGVIDVNAGVKNDGTLTAWEFHNYNSGGSSIQPLYEIPNLKAEFHSSRAPLRQGSYRALASTANTFARESHIDDLAHAVKMDPLEFRLKNLKDTRFRAVLQAAAKQFGWGVAKPAANHGFGIAGGSDKGSYVATCAEIAVDPETGGLRIVRLVSAFECGAVINPEHLKNQIEGAAVMGIGGALFEAIQFENGKILNPRLAKYRVPRFSDSPSIEVVLLDRKDSQSAGAGETPIIGVAPAIGNAIFQATGTRLRSMPMVPNGLKKI